MAHSQEINTVDAAELDRRAAAIASELGVSNEREAFAMLERGDLDGTWLEVELKMVRHLRGESPEYNPPLAAE